MRSAIPMPVCWRATKRCPRGSMTRSSTEPCIFVWAPLPKGKGCASAHVFGEKNENSGGRRHVAPMLEWRHFSKGDVPPCGNWLKLADRKSTRLNSSHSQISYAVFCLKKE